MEKTIPLRNILARNLREHRRKCGFSQEKLAEKAGISTQYLAMIEIARKFPASKVLERLAESMNIKVYELFLIDYSPREEHKEGSVVFVQSSPRSLCVFFLILNLPVIINTAGG